MYGDDLWSISDLTQRTLNTRQTIAYPTEKQDKIPKNKPEKKLTEWMMKEQNHVFHHRMFYCLHWAIPEKIQTGRLRIWNFHGYQRNSMSSFQGLTKNELEYPRVTKEKIMWNFQVSLFLVLEFPRDLTQFCGIAKGWALFCLELPGVTAVMAGNDTF